MAALTVIRGVVLGAALVPATGTQATEWRLYEEAMTEFLLTVGMSVGYMPDPYLEAINAAMVKVDAYSELTADLIGVALRDSVLLRTQVGWRPVDDLGTSLDLQYTFMGLGGGMGSENLVVGGAELQPLPDNGSPNSFDLDSAIHMVGLEVGYTWEFDSGLTLRAGLGFELTMAADFEIVARNDGPGVELVESGAKAYLDQVFVEWVNTPHVALAAGYRFF